MIIKQFKHRGFLLPLVFIILSLAINLAYNLTTGSFGPFHATDTAFYVNTANDFAESGFSGFLDSGLPVYYWLYPIFISINILLFGDHYTLSIILVQMVLMSTASIAIFYFTSNILDRTTAIFASFLFILTWEIFRWSNFILTDSINVFLLSWFLFFVILFILRRNFYFLMPALVVLFVQLLLRPTNLILAVIAIIILISVLTAKHNRMIVVVIAVGVFAVMALFLLIIDNDHNRLTPTAYYNYYLQSLQSGEVIPGMPQYDIEPGDESFESMLKSIAFYLKVFAKRLVFFWSIYLEPHSLLHKGINILWLTPLFVFGIYGLVLASINKSMNKNVNYLFLSFLIIYTIFHAATHIDFDQRYRVPLLVVLIIYSAHGMTSFYKVHLAQYFNKKLGRDQ